MESDFVKPKVVVIIQARMGSQRLPGKMMVDICGKPLLEYLIERVKRSQLLDVIVIATTPNKEDDVIEEFAKKFRVEVFRGSEEDVLARYFEAAEHFHADVVVRICGDNPLTDPREVDKLIQHHLSTGADYSANSSYHLPSPKGLPDGVGAEIFSMDALRKAYKLATEQYHREHVTPFILRNPNLFRIERLDAEPGLQRPDIELDVDNLEGLQYVRKVFQQLLVKQIDPIEASTKEIIGAVESVGLKS